MTVWHELATDPPVGDRCVILFPMIANAGILYTASNPEYARVNALEDGYTHYMYIDPPSRDLEDEAISKREAAEKSFADLLASGQPIRFFDEES